MACLESVFAGLRQVCSFVEEITLSDRKRWNLNFALVGPGNTRPDPAAERLSLDNLSGHPNTGGH